jgi:DinB family protein
MSNDSLTIEQVMTRLAEHPPRIATLTEGLTPTQLRACPSPDEWSANDVLAHLRSCADVWGNYIRLILTEDRPKIRAVSPRTWIHRTDYPALEFSPSFHAFTIQRADLLAVLEPLPPETWSRAAMVTMVGKVMDRTVLDYASRLVIHERSHVNQIEQIVNMMRM